MSGTNGYANEIKEAIERIANPMQVDYGRFLLCEVVSVDEDARTCDVKPVNDITETVIPGVNLSAAPNDGEYAKPELGSVVLIARFIKQESYVVKFSDLAKWKIVADEVVLNDTTYGGVPIADEVASKVNNNIDILKQACVAAFGALSGLDSGASLAAFNSSVAALLPINSVDLQNQNVKHG
jgi:hypothetical protein